jgi:hypothetical protein
MNFLQDFATCEAVCQAGTAGLPLNLTDAKGQALLTLVGCNELLETKFSLLAQGALNLLVQCACFFARFIRRERHLTTRAGAQTESV